MLKVRSSIGLVLVALVLEALPVNGQDKKPNILVIMGDDVGIPNLSIYSHGMMG